MCRMGLASLEAGRRLRAGEPAELASGGSSPRARQAARPSLCRHQVQAPWSTGRGRAPTLPRRSEPSLHTPCKISRLPWDLLGLRGLDRRREEFGHTIGLLAGLNSAWAGRRGSGGPPLQPSGLRKIFLGQWQAGRCARIGAGALLITVETQAEGNAGGCRALGGGSQRVGWRRLPFPELPGSF